MPKCCSSAFLSALIICLSSCPDLLTAVVWWQLTATNDYFYHPIVCHILTPANSSLSKKKVWKWYKNITSFSSPKSYFIVSFVSQCTAYPLRSDRFGLTCRAVKKKKITSLTRLHIFLGLLLPCILYTLDLRSPDTLTGTHTQDPPSQQCNHKDYSRKSDGVHEYCHIWSKHPYVVTAPGLVIHHTSVHLIRPSNRPIPNESALCVCIRRRYDVMTCFISHHGHLCQIAFPFYWYWHCVLRGLHIMI